MEKHANFSPSRLSRIMACPGSVQLIEAINLPPGQPSSYAMHGTKLHDYTHLALENNRMVLNELDVDDRALVNDCLDYFSLLVKSLGHRNYMKKFESRISLKSWGIPDVWGTSDVLLIDNVKLHAHVIDWKFGSGVMVYAEDNPQLMAYAAGSIGWPTNVKTITLHIVQPAKEHYDTWDITVQELHDWVHGKLASAINRSLYDEPTFNPGLSQCRWCEAKHHCDTYFTYVQNTATALFEGVKLLPKYITPTEISLLLQNAPLVEQAIKDFKKFITVEIQRGVEYPGYKLVAGRSNRKWKDEVKAAKWMGENTGIEELFKSKLISPAQAEKLSANLRRDEDFKELWDKPEGKPTLVSDKDPRPALQPESRAVDVFRDYTEAPDKLV